MSGELDRILAEAAGHSVLSDPEPTPGRVRLLEAEKAILRQALELVDEFVWDRGRIGGADVSAIVRRGIADAEMTAARIFEFAEEEA